MILHGVSEISEADDKSYVKSLLGLIGVNIEPTEIIRLGKENDNGRFRPIKLMMSSIEHKNLILSRLVNLRNAEDKYRQISIKEDYTFEEREMV